MLKNGNIRKKIKTNKPQQEMENDKIELLQEKFKFRYRVYTQSIIVPQIVQDKPRCSTYRLMQWPGGFSI